MILSHYAAAPLLEQLTPTDQRGESPVGPYKPRGLWVSVDGEHDWVEWCVAEGFGLERLKVRSIVELAPDANVLRLTTADDLMAFTAEYVGTAHQDQRNWFLDSKIDWDRVAAAHQGLIIAPYCWAKRLELMWYYGWDCASGCIWDVRAIKSIAVDLTWVAPVDKATGEPCVNS